MKDQDEGGQLDCRSLKAGAPFHIIILAPTIKRPKNTVLAKGTVVFILPTARANKEAHNDGKGDVTGFLWHLPR